MVHLRDLWLDCAMACTSVAGVAGMLVAVNFRRASLQGLRPVRTTDQSDPARSSVCLILSIAYESREGAMAELRHSADRPAR